MPTKADLSLIFRLKFIIFINNKLVIHKILTNSGKLFLFLQILFKKLIPTDVAVVKIAIKIIIPYILLHLVNVCFTTYTTGISKFVKSISTFTNNKKIRVDITNIIIAVIVDTKVIFFCFFINLFKLIKTGINKIKL